MKSKKYAIVFLFLIVAYSPFSVASQESYTEENIETSYQGIPITVHARYTLNDKMKSCSVKNIFDENPNTVWCTKKLDDSYDGQKPSLVISFGKEVYVDEVSILTGCGSDHRGNVKLLGIEKTIFIPRTYPFGENYKLKSERAEQSVIISRTTNHKNIYDLFPAKELMLEIFDTHDDKEWACIAEFKIKAKNQLDYKPKHSWTGVKAYIDANADIWKAGGGWDFKKRDTKEIQFLNESYFTELTYYAIRGNKEAATLFLKNTPIGSADSAVMQHHYKPLMKELLTRKGIAQ